MPRTKSTTSKAAQSKRRRDEDEEKQKGADCDICLRHLARTGDMSRHLKKHLKNKDSVYHRCPFPDCKFSNIQKSNVETHIRTHTRDKSKICPDCEFRTTDPGSLTRHRKRFHAYVPKPRKPRTKHVQVALPPRANVSDIPSTSQVQVPVPAVAHVPAVHVPAPYFPASRGFPQVPAPRISMPQNRSPPPLSALPDPVLFQQQEEEGMDEDYDYYDDGNDYDEYDDDFDDMVDVRACQSTPSPAPSSASSSGHYQYYAPQPRHSCSIASSSRGPSPVAYPTAGVSGYQLAAPPAPQHPHPRWSSSFAPGLPPTQFVPRNYAAPPPPPPPRPQPVQQPPPPQPQPVTTEQPRASKRLTLYDLLVHRVRIGPITLPHLGEFVKRPDAETKAAKDVKLPSPDLASADYKMFWDFLISKLPSCTPTQLMTAIGAGKAMGDVPSHIAAIPGWADFISLNPTVKQLVISSARVITEYLFFRDAKEMEARAMREKESSATRALAELARMMNITLEEAIRVFAPATTDTTPTIVLPDEQYICETGLQFPQQQHQQVEDVSFYNTFDTNVYMHCPADPWNMGEVYSVPLSPFSGSDFTDSSSDSSSSSDISEFLDPRVFEDFGDC